jgi:basic membrane protein A
MSIRMMGLLVAVLIAVGCDNRTTSVTAKFRVAMILPGNDNDKGWNQMAREGLDEIHDQLGAETKIVTNVKASEFASQINYFAGEGFDVVICHGFEFRTDASAAARKFPKTQFVVGGCPEEVPGAIAVDFLVRDASYLTGVVAANVSKTRTIAFVGAMPIPSLRSCYDGMKDGAASVKEGTPVKVLPALWTDSWDSAAKAKEKAETAIGAGADVIFQNVDAAAQGVFEAAIEGNKQKPMFAFGCNRNQNNNAPQVILGSVVIDVPRTYRELAHDAQGKTPATQTLKLGLKGGYVDLVFNDKHSAITPAIRAQVDAARKELLTKNP